MSTERLTGTQVSGSYLALVGSPGSPLFEKRRREEEKRGGGGRRRKEEERDIV